MTNNGAQIKLTISLLVSNRKDTVPKCLESLRPLLKLVNSELIITDTGCDEDLVTYMKQYTDNIVRFKWCNDFAKARNVGLKMAKGQWFMYIDDDEWFESVDELVEFFNSDEESKYTSASYVVRNYIDMKGTAYSEGVVGRIFRINEDMGFVGKVHEQIRRPAGEEKQFVSYVHHYGYVFETEEKRKAHFERNTSLLRKEIEDNPGEARYYAHIYQEYKVMEEMDVALEYAFKALDNVTLDTNENKVAMCSTYVCVLWAYNKKKEYEKSVEWGERFLTGNPVTCLTKAAMLSYMAEAYINLDNYAKAMECTDEYIGYMDMFKYNQERYYKELGPLLNDTFKDTRSGIAISAGLKAAIEIEDIAKAVNYVLAYDWSKKIYMIEPECLSKFVYVASKINYDGSMDLYRDIVRAFGKIFTNVSSSNIVLTAVSELKGQDERSYLAMCNIMARVTGQPGYNDLVNIITSYRNNDIQKLELLYEKVVGSDMSIFCMEKEFYEIAIDKMITLGKLINKLDVENFGEKARKWLSVARNKDIIICKKCIDNINGIDNAHRDIFEKVLINVLEKRKNKTV